MRTRPPGTLLKPSRPHAGITLEPTPQSRRLTEHLHDLIMITYERSTNRLGSSLSLTRLEYVYGENKDGKFSMLLNALVRDHTRDAIEPVTLTFTAELEYPEC